MPIRDQAAQERSLDNDYGPTRGPNAPDAHEVALFMGDPDLGGLEVAGGGYARAALDSDDWLLAADGAKVSPTVTFPDTTDEWPGTVTHAALYDPVEGLWWDSVPLEEPLDVTGPGDSPQVVLSIFYDTNLD